MNTRILPVEEWPKVTGAMLPYVEPRNAAMVVVENDGRIIARQGVYSITYLEGLWIDKEFRGHPGVARSLIRHAFAIPKMRGEHWILTAADDDKTRGILDRLGNRMPFDYYAISVDGGDLCRQR